MLLHIPVHASTPQITNARAGLNGDATRFVLELTAPVTFEAFTLAEPDRVVLDLSRSAWALSGTDHVLDTGVILNLRYGMPANDISRVVLDVRRPVRIRGMFLLPPSQGFQYRLVVDLIVDDTGANTATEQEVAEELESLLALPRLWATQAREADKAVPIPTTKPESGKYTIVIDAGHGGKDPGAIGASGKYEKHVTLAAARELRDILLASNRYRVILTRDMDEGLRLRDRVIIARLEEADLFISIHADAAERKAARGASIYTLSETASDKEAEALARKENKSDLLVGIDLDEDRYDPLTTNILIDLAQRGTSNASSDFAEHLTRELGAVVELRSHAHRFAGFRVLKAPDVPSVLIEIGFMSNPEEERLIHDRSYRARMLTAVARAVDRFFAD